MIKRKIVEIFQVKNKSGFPGIMPYFHNIYLEDVSRRKRMGELDIFWIMLLKLIKERGRHNVNWTGLTQDRIQWRALLSTNRIREFVSPTSNWEVFNEKPETQRYKLSKTDSAPYQSVQSVRNNSLFLCRQSETILRTETPGAIHFFPLCHFLSNNYRFRKKGEKNRLSAEAI
jgi:hypothetical protein